MLMKTLNPCLALTLCALITLPSTAAHAAKLYKWVDDAGQVRYGDSIPPQYARKSNETLNDQGIVVNRQDAAKTSEQIAKEERAAKAAAEAERIRKEKAHQDRILLDTFTNEDEMLMTRDGKIAAIEAVIRISNDRAEKLKQHLAQLTQRAANLERAGKPVPESLTAEIAESRQKIDQNRQYIENRKAEQQNIRDRFAADIRRFHELKSIAAAAEK
jgi:hypothetical protein